MNKDWTDKLPELLEGYTEAEPEGLWDAVRTATGAGSGVRSETAAELGSEAGSKAPAGAPVVAPKPRKRRVAVLWWSVAALVAAAAALVVFLLKPAPVPPSVLPVPEGRLVQAKEAEPEAPVELQDNPQEQDSQGMAQSPKQPRNLVRSEPKSNTRQGQQPTDQVQPTGVDQVQEQPLDQVLPQPQEKPQETQTVDQLQPTESDQAQGQIRPELQQNTPQGHQTLDPVQNRSQRIQKPVTRKKWQFTITSGAYLALAGSTVTNGYGMAGNPGMAVYNTKADEGSFITVPMLRRNQQSTTEATHRQSLRLAVGVSYDFATRWSIASGLSYTMLRSDYNTTSGETTTNTTRHLHYLGIPLNLQWKALEWKRISLYLSAGPMWETSLAARVSTRSFVGEKLASEKAEPTSVRDNRWSLNAGIGLQYQLFRRGALYLQPGLSWHISYAGAPESYYTTHPLAPEFTFGYRFTF